MLGQKEMLLEKGYIQVYTGNGKGKTTAALGLALRAAGAGLRVYIAQFMKKGHYSEIRALERLSDRVTVEQFGTGRFVHGKPDPADLEAGRKGLEEAREAMLSGDYDMVVLEEANVAYESKIVSEQDLMDFVSAKPDGVELVFTGRGGAPAVLQRADLITEMKPVLNYFEQGVGARAPESRGEQMDGREIHLVLGGCRSGKSSRALALADARTAEKNIFVATCMPADDEMQARVVRHQQERDSKWQTVEEPIEIARVIREHGREGEVDVILVDCLTLWISNIMARHKDDDEVMEHVKDLGRALDDAACPVFLVSNEVGAGIVPENAMARRFRDLAGFVNQHAARCARHVTWMVAGIAVKIK